MCYIIRNTYIFHLWPWLLKTFSLSPFPGTQLLKPLVSLKWGVFLYANEVSGGWGLMDSLRMGADCQGCCVIIGLELSAPPYNLQKTEGLEFKLINGQWFNHLCLSNEASIKSWRTGFWEFWVGEHEEVLGSDMSGEGMEAPVSFSPYLALCILSTWNFLSCTLW